MIKLLIVIHCPHKAIEKYVKEDPREINKTVYNFLTHYNIDEEIVIDCASFCELAIIGESYNTEDFDVYIEGT